MSNATLTAADTIMQQLGGSRFTAMVGAKNVLGCENYVQFGIGRNGMHITHVKIVLNSMDTYDVTFYRVRAGRIVDQSTDENVYAEDLRHVFEEYTGLRTSL